MEYSIRLKYLAYAVWLPQVSLQIVFWSLKYACHYCRAEEEECLGRPDALLPNLWPDPKKWGGGLSLCSGDGPVRKNRQVIVLLIQLNDTIL